jgi:Major tropism determinant N-terminal domain
MPRLQLKRGLKANLPSAAMLPGEAHFTTDRGTLHIATGATTRLPIVPPVDDLGTMPSVDGAADMILIHDASETAAPKEKKITVNAFRTALNIPASDLDEKTAVVSGGTSGYLWGTNGTDGVVRMNTSMAWTKDAGNGFVTLAVGDVDCGTF